MGIHLANFRTDGRVNHQVTVPDDHPGMEAIADLVHTVGTQAVLVLFRDGSLLVYTAADDEDGV